MAIVLSLFPGVGLLDLAFELEGFCVVRGPDVLWGGDIRRFNPPAGKFDGIIGGPPCQAFSRLAHMVRHNGLQPKFGNLIPEFERCVREAQPQWFLMENVPDAPVPKLVGDYWCMTFVLNNRQCLDENGEPAKQHRARRFTFGHRDEAKFRLEPAIVVFESLDTEYAACGGGSGGAETVTRKKRGLKGNLNDCVGANIKSAASFRRICESQGLPGDFDLEPFTVTAKCKAVGNGVPLPMGRTIARAVKEAISG